MDAIQSRIKATIKARGGFLSRIPCFRARNPRYMKNEAIAPGCMESGSQIAFALAHPAAAMRHTVISGYLVLSARRVKPVEKKRAQRNHSRPICRIAKGSVWGIPAPYNKAPSMLFALCKASISGQIK